MGRPEWPAPWRGVHGKEARALLSELERELAAGHALYGNDLAVIARRDERDDIVVQVRKGPFPFAVVHLTWRGLSDLNLLLPRVLFRGNWRELDAYVEDEASVFADDGELEPRSYKRRSLNPNGLVLLKRHKFWAATLVGISLGLSLWLIGLSNPVVIGRFILQQMGLTLLAVFASPWLSNLAQKKEPDWKLLLPPTGVWGLSIIALLRAFDLLS